MYHTLWQSVLGEIELTIPHSSFATWFKNTKLVDKTDQAVIIEVPNIFAKTQFESKFDPQIRDILLKNGVAIKKIDYVVPTKSVANRKISRETTLENKESAPKAIGSVFAKQKRSVQSNGLNQRYKFNNFIVGSSNDLAYTACQAVAKNPGSKYNPLFLYGGVGLGKTHLMQAVGNEIVENNQDMKVSYITSETFVKEFLEYIRFKKKGFSDKYRNVDVLIVDDMQFIAGKEKTQEEFFHTFNELHQNNKQIIISSDKPPRNIPTLTERLRSRFEWGMAIDIQMPDFETRCAIIEAKAENSGVKLDIKTVEFLANNIKTNVRELEGALNQLLAYSEMRGIAPDISIAEGLISNVRSSRPQHLTPKQIVDKTARYFQIESKEVCSPKRDRHIVVPRQIAMYLLRSELHLSFPRIAKELGRKDHTTAIHSVEKIEKSIKLDATIRGNVSEIKEKLYA